MLRALIALVRVTVASGFLIAGSLGGFVATGIAAPPYGSPGYLDRWMDNGFDPLTKRRIRPCVPASNYRLRSRVEEQGYFNIYVGGDIGRSGNLELRATRGKSVYLLEVDKCSGKVEAEHYFRPAVNGR